MPEDQAARMVTDGEGLGLVLLASNPPGGQASSLERRWRLTQTSMHRRCSPTSEAPTCSFPQARSQRQPYQSINWPKEEYLIGDHLYFFLQGTQ